MLSADLLLMENNNWIVSEIVRGTLKKNYRKKESKHLIEFCIDQVG